MNTHPHDRQIGLVPGVTIWRAVRHYPDKVCELDDTVLPVVNPRGFGFNLRIIPLAQFLPEHELISGLFRGMVALLDHKGPENWTHATVISVFPASVRIRIEPPMPGYCQWRYEVQQAFLAARKEADAVLLPRAKQIEIIRAHPCPDGKQYQRSWIGDRTHELLTI